MMHPFVLVAVSIMALTIAPTFHAVADAQTTAPPQQVILNPTKEAETRIAPTSNQVTVTRARNPNAPGVLVQIQPGKEQYPGISIQPAGKSWDFSAFGHVEARVVNTGAKPLSVSLRVDNAGDWRDNPWNTESLFLAPGTSGTVTTILGYAYGHKPGYALKPSAIVNLLLFTSKSDAAQSFRLTSLVAGGPAGETPPVAPEEVRLKPKNGFLLGPGGLPAVRAMFPAATGEQKDQESVRIQPPMGRWDLRDYLEVRVQVRNDGKKSVTPRVRLDSNGGVSDWTVGAALMPGKAEEIAVPFAGTTPADPSDKNTGSHITSDAVSAVTLAPQDAAGEQRLSITAIKADLLPAQIPAWLGQRPPAAGEWVKTLDDEFNGSALNPAIWSIYGDNYWDKQTHWSKDDVLVGGGLVRLRYEKKTGFNNDDPTQKRSAYAAGYLHTYDKWTQRYGYFEARMKLPTAPGLWPAFWMMPDRGRAAGPEQWKRQDTGNGGMEFDIMEHLTRWGPHRYNIAMHYDGYGKDHKSLGSDKIYVQPDKDGFLTCGLLWMPGSVTYYCNDREVLRWTNPRISSVPEILMFTLPMGGWDNSPLQDSRLPDEFVIDYVRVWQRKDLLSSSEGK